LRRGVGGHRRIEYRLLRLVEALGAGPPDPLTRVIVRLGFAGPCFSPVTIGGVAGCVVLGDPAYLQRPTGLRPVGRLAAGRRAV
jgi:hypothetical protein